MSATRKFVTLWHREPFPTHVVKPFGVIDKLQVKLRSCISASPQGRGWLYMEYLHDSFMPCKKRLFLQ